MILQRTPGRYTSEERRIVDSVLRDFPALSLCLKRRRDYITAMCSGGGDGGRVQGGEAVPMAERVLLALTSDPEYCELASVVERLNDALYGLSDRVFAVVREMYFRGKPPMLICEEMGVGEKWLRLRRASIYENLSGIIFQLYPMVRRWRQREQKRSEEAIENQSMKYVNCG